MSPADERRSPAQYAIDALRVRGALRLDPARFRHIEALARRSAAHHGEARRLLDERLDRLLADCAQRVGPESPVSPRREPPRAPATPSALSGLLAHLARQAGAPGSGPGPDSPPDPAPTELRALRQHRSTWTRLKVDRQMARAQARVPDNAGPLHTQRLLHQALTMMRDLSPDYVHRLMTHVETLLSLNPSGPVAAASRKPPSTRPRNPQNSERTP